MSMFVRLIAGAGVACAALGQVQADEADDRAAILRVLQKTFDAVASGDPDDWRPLLTKEARTLSFAPGPDAPDGALLMRERSLAKRLEPMTPPRDRYFERWLGEPTVMIRGPIAVVWGEYDFWLNGAFRHCGVDTVNLAKVDGVWKIAHLMYTVEFEACATADDPPPEGATRVTGGRL